jgi:hypothetical protein
MDKLKKFQLSLVLIIVNNKRIIFEFYNEFN